MGIKFTPFAIGHGSRFADFLGQLRWKRPSALTLTRQPFFVTGANPRTGYALRFAPMVHTQLAGMPTLRGIPASDGGPEFLES